LKDLTEKTGEKLESAVTNGKEGAYVELIERHYRRVFGVCMGVFGNVHDAEDVAQDTMMRGLKQFDTLKDKSQFSSWITRIARNRCIDIFRQRKRDRQLHHIQAEKLASEQSTKTTNEPELTEAIQKLPVELRIPLVMYYFENKSAKKIAELLEISHSNACQRLRRARQHLHTILIEKEGI
jgi:RNA polymerase sigma-70 factor (ECF subfamily)